MAKERLLVVEDEAIVRESVIRILRRADLDVDGVESGEAGLEMLQKQPYDLLLVDIRMPRMSGIEFLREARRHGSTAGAMVITGYATLEHTVEAMELGAVGFLMKPVYPQQLVQSVRDALARLRMVRNVGRLPAYADLMDLGHAVSGEAGEARTAEAFLGLIGHEAGAVFIRGSEGNFAPIASRLPAATALTPDQVAGLERDWRATQTRDRLVWSWPELRTLDDVAPKAVALPLAGRDRLAGLLVVTEEHQLAPGDMDYLRTVARFLAVTLENGRAHAAAQAQVKALEARLAHPERRG